MSRAKVLLVSLPFAAFAAAVMAGACVGDPPDPGYESTGGAGGAGGDGGATQSSVTSTVQSTGQTTTSTNAGTTAATTNATTTTTSVSTTDAVSTGAGLMCDDPGDEPNETEASATDLGTIEDCDDTGGSIVGLLAGINDTDWYKYLATDENFCQVDPTKSLTSSDPVVLCKFIQCADNEPADVTCPDGTTAETSPDGRSGCCGPAGFDVDLDCPGLDEEATVYFRVTTEDNVCVSYTIDYHF